jgi:hypothetical protein
MLQLKNAGELGLAMYNAFYAQDVYVLYDPNNLPHTSGEVRNRIGIALDLDSPGFVSEENLERHAAEYGIPMDEAKKQVTQNGGLNIAHELGHHKNWRS